MPKFKKKKSTKPKGEQLIYVPNHGLLLSPYYNEALTDFEVQKVAILGCDTNKLREGKCLAYRYVS